MNLSAISLFLALTLIPGPSILYAWTPQQKAQADGNCAKVPGLQEKAEKENGLHTGKKSQADGLKTKANKALSQLNPLIAEFKQKEKSLEKISGAQDNLDFMKTIICFHVSHIQVAGGSSSGWTHEGKVPAKESYFKPVFDWMKDAQKCINSIDSLLPLCSQSLKQNPKPSQEAANRIGTLLRSKEPPMPVPPITAVTCPEGAPISGCPRPELNVTTMVSDMGSMMEAKKWMETQKPKMRTLREGYHDSLKESDKLFGEATEHLAKAKDFGRQAKQLSNSADGLMGVNSYCKVRVKDYSAEAERLKAETEKLLSIAKGLKK